MRQQKYSPHFTDEEAKVLKKIRQAQIHKAIKQRTRKQTLETYLLTSIYRGTEIIYLKTSPQCLTHRKHSTKVVITETRVSCTSPHRGHSSQAKIHLGRKVKRKKGLEKSFEELSIHFVSTTSTSYQKLMGKSSLNTKTTNIGKRTKTTHLQARLRNQVRTRKQTQ